MQDRVGNESGEGDKAGNVRRGRAGNIQAVERNLSLGLGWAPMTRRIIVGVTGASGAVLALETLRQLAQAKAETHLVVSRGAEPTIRHELGHAALAEFSALATWTHSPDDLSAPIASGSYRSDGMIVVPCSMRSLGFCCNVLITDAMARPLRHFRRARCSKAASSTSQ